MRWEERKGHARKSRARRRDNVAPVLQVDQAKEVRTEQHNGHGERRKMQNGPSSDEVGIWIKSKRGQRLSNRAISDLEESRSPPYSTSAFVTSLCYRCCYCYCCCCCCCCCYCYCYYCCYSVVIRPGTRSGQFLLTDLRAADLVVHVIEGND